MSGFLGRWIASGIIESSCRKFLRGVYFRSLISIPENRPFCVFANHNYWWDVYAAYFLRKKLKRNLFGWMKHVPRFPPFKSLGALPFPENDAARRLKTISRTLQILKNDSSSVFYIYPESELNRANDFLPFSRSLIWMKKKIPEMEFFPLYIHLDNKIHQYPRLFLTLGDAWEPDKPEGGFWGDGGKSALEKTKDRFLNWFSAQPARIPDKDPDIPADYELIMKGRLSIHEKWYSRLFS